MVSRLRTSALLRAFLLLAIGAACHRARPATNTPAPKIPGAAASAAPSAGDALLPLAATTAALPERIDDTTFWRMVRTMSEPGGSFISENFVSNEMGLQYVVARLRTTIPPGGVYIGVGPEQNFTYLATLKPRIAFIVDIRRQNLLQHLWYKAVFELSPTRAQFLSRLFARPLPPALTLANGGNVPSDTLIARLEEAAPDSLLFQRVFNEVRHQLVSVHGFTLDSADLATLRYVDNVFYLSGPSLNYSSGQRQGGFGGSRRMPSFAQIATTTDESGVNIGFLGSDSAYRVVRDMHRRNLIVPLVGDFAGSSALRNVGAWLAARQARVGAFYVSNVEQYLWRQGDDWSRFYANVGSMPLDSNSQFIRSTQGGRGFGAGMPNGGFMMMQQLTSPILPIVEAARAGNLIGYGDVIGRSR